MHSFLYPEKTFSFMALMKAWRKLCLMIGCLGLTLCACTTGQESSPKLAPSFSPAKHFENLELQNREATDSLEALSDNHYRIIVSDSSKHQKAELLRNRTERMLQYIDNTYSQLAKVLDNIPSNKNYKEVTVMFFVGKNKKGTGYRLENELQSYVDDIEKIHPNWKFASPFLSQNEVEILHDEKTDLVEAHFQKTFPEAAFAFLSALKKEVVQIELQAINELVKE